MRFIDLAGQPFGRLLVISRAKNTKDGKPRWLCRCACGATLIVRSSDLKSGATVSCSCHRREAASKRWKKHGEARKITTEYRIWNNAKSRCFLPTNRAYKNYGARGVVMCSAWRESFPAFLQDMGRRPKGLTLNRRNNSGNYSCGKCQQCIEQGWPANCFWATWFEQANNRRGNRWLTIGTETKTVAQWSDQSGVSRAAIKNRLDNLHWPTEKAVSEPVSRRCRHF